MKKRWLITESIPEVEVNRLSDALKVDTVVAEILLQRNVENFQEAQNFFRPDLQNLHDPFLMKNMDMAVERLNLAIKQNDSVQLYGDYDVDGTSSVALIFTYFSKKVRNLTFYIPDRYAEGYGVSQSGMEKAAKEGIQLIITLDCGIKNKKELDWARAQGIDVIVCDHHEPGEELPDAIILNPKQVDCEYPFKELCGCGVGFKLIQGFHQKNNGDLDEIYGLLDFVAIATGADIVSVLGENRILTYHGLKLLNENTRPNFQKLLDIAGKKKPLTLTDVVFTIAPRINAAGRINVGSDSVELMISTEEAKIQQFAENINAHNTERRGLDEVITKEALEMVEELSLAGGPEARRTTVVYKDGWSKGVVGIVASRLIEKHFRPTIVFSENDGMLTGSARTVNDFDIYKSLLACEDLLEKFGGHTHAAGLTIKKENIQTFQTRFEAVVRENILLEDLSPTEHVDLAIDFNTIFKSGESLQKLPRLKRVLDQLEPHGPGNMKPVFLSTNVYAVATKVLKEKHLKLSLTQPDCTFSLEAIGFNLADKIDLLAAGLPVDVLYTLESNVWNDKTTLQLNIKDIRETV
jgi:single-stranded-DNA-specific exonuclease